MTVVIRVAGANWSGKGLPTIYPFIANNDLEFGFDFRDGPELLLDSAGRHTITPKRVEPSAGILNVTDPSIMVPVDSGQGIRVDDGYLQCSLPIIPIPAGGSRQFTFMLVSRGGGVTFPPAKVVSSTPTAMVLLDWGCHVSGSGFEVDRVMATGLNNACINKTTGNLTPESGTKSLTTPEVLFLTYDGTSWTLTNKTFGFSQTRTNAEMAVTNPIPLYAQPWTDNRLNLGGNANRTGTLRAYYPVLYQRAMWNRVLTGDEITEQYERSKASRPTLGL